MSRQCNIRTLSASRFQVPSRPLFRCSVIALAASSQGHDVESPCLDAAPLSFHNLSQPARGLPSASVSHPRWTARKPRRSPRQAAWSHEDRHLREQQLLEELLRSREAHAVAARATEEPFAASASEAVEAVLERWVGRVTRVELSAVLKALGQQGCTECCLALFEWMERQRGRLRPNGHAYCLMLGILGRSGRLRAASRLFASFRQRAFRDKVHGFNAMLAALLRSGQPRAAWLLFSDMRRQRLLGGQGGPQGSTGASDVAAWCLPRDGNAGSGSSSGWREQQEVPGAPLPAAAATALASDLPGSADTAPEEEAQRGSGDGGEAGDEVCLTSGGAVWRDVASVAADWAAPPAPDAVTYNTMMGACDGGVDSAWLAALLAGEGQQGGAPPGAVPPPTASSAGAVEWDGRGEPWDGVNSSLLAPSKGDPPGVGSGERSAAGQEAAVLSLTSPDDSAVTPEKAEATRLALLLYREMQSRGLTPTIRTFNALLSLISRCGTCSQAEEVVREMRCSSVPMDDYSFNALMTTYARAQRPDDALQVFRRARSSGRPLSAATFTAAMAAFCAAGRPGDAVAAFEDMRRAGCRPDVAAFGALAAAWKEAGKPRQAEAVLRQMQAEGLRPNTVVFSTVVLAYGRQGLHEEALRVFDRMLLAGCAPDRTVFNILLAAYARAGLAAHGARLCRSMLAHGVAPDAVSFNTLIAACCQAGLPAQALRWHARMRAAGVPADELTEVLVQRALGEAGQSRVHGEDGWDEGEEEEAEEEEEEKEGEEEGEEEEEDELGTACQGPSLGQ